MGELAGVFVATDEQVKILIDEQIEVYFGEVLGKHSEVWGEIESKEMELVTEDSKVVDLFNEYDLSSGLNPFDYTITGFDFEKWGLDEDDHCDDSVGEIIDMIIKTRKKDNK